MTISAEDVKQIRRIVVERDYFKAAFEESENQKNLWRKSSADWKALYESEKARADGVQESRIAELRRANDELTKANSFYKQQAADDRQKLGEQEFTIRKLKSERKWYFAAGFGTGFAAGGYLGYRFGGRFRF